MVPLPDSVPVNVGAVGAECTICLKFGVLEQGKPCAIETSLSVTTTEEMSVYQISTDNEVGPMRGVMLENSGYSSGVVGF